MVVTHKISNRFSRAVEYARAAHDGQMRKGTSTAYLSHLLGVASLVLDYGGDEAQAIAALLHDVVEDQGQHHLEIVRKKFGDRVAKIVEACTDGTLEGKSEAKTPEAKRADWRRRKERYLKHLERAPKYALLVSGADKLHNARAVLSDLRDPNIGAAVFDRFTGGKEGTLWNYEALADVFTRRGSPIARELRRIVQELKEESGAKSGVDVQGRDYVIERLGLTIPADDPMLPGIKQLEADLAKRLAPRKN